MLEILGFPSLIVILDLTPQFLRVFLTGSVRDPLAAYMIGSREFLQNVNG